MLAHRRAARMEEISEHGRPVSYRALHKSKKVYDRKRLKRTDINLDDGCPFFCVVLTSFGRAVQHCEHRKICVTLEERNDIVFYQSEDSGASRIYSAEVKKMVNNYD